MPDREKRQWFKHALSTAGLSQQRLAEEANKILKARYPDDEEKRITQSGISQYIYNRQTPRQYRIDAMDKVFQEHHVHFVKGKFAEERKGA